MPDCRLDQLDNALHLSGTYLAQVVIPLRDLSRTEISVQATGATAIVILSHRWPDQDHQASAGAVLRQVAQERPVLVLHGHDHRDFNGSLWAEVTLGEFDCYRSKVCSCVSSRRGLGHLIDWNGGRFTHTLVQGARPNNPLQPMSGGRETGDSKRA